MNCINCDANAPTTCIQCSSGYYLDANSTCQLCAANCLACDSNTFCTIASNGYFIPTDGTGALSGQIAQCQSPCATCIDQSDSCLSCISGFNLIGSVCSQNHYLLMTIVFGPGSGASPIFLATDSNSTQLYNGIKSINRIGNMLSAISPAEFKTNGFADWKKQFIFQSIAVGSIQTTVQANGGSYTQSSTAANAMTTAVSTTPLDGLTYVSSSIVGFNFVDASSQSENHLGLILGIVIPIVIISTKSLI